MIEIIPAIIPKTFKDLERGLQSVTGLVPLAQIDIMDGKFTPEASWPYLNQQEDPDFISIKKEEKEFPSLEEIDFEVDLMVKNPENIWFDWIIAGAKRIIFHYESTEKLKELLQDCKQKLVSKESVLYVEVGLAIDINTPNDRIYPHLENIDFVQFMGIEKIGFQGQPFDERVLQKIKDFKNQYTKVQISVDGGVNLDTAPLLVKAGANRLVSGSAIFKSNDIMSTIEQFKNL
ncbi:MAG: hypothetical protein AAB534_02265 [Patescibacteria group bacterium]